MKTILLSTSTLWNCGDDFIRDGLLELLKPKDDIRMIWWNRGYGISNAYANSLKENLALMNYFLVAGTPKWVFNNEAIYKYCLKKAIPLSIIGVGTRDIINNSQYRLLKKIAQSGLCECALARDHIAYSTLEELGFKDVELILDPCFFKAPLSDQREKINIIGWRKQYHLDGDPLLVSKHPFYVVKEVLKKIFFRQKQRSRNKAQYDKLLKDIFDQLPDPKKVIVHDNREIKPAEKLFGKDSVFYATDYNNIFSNYARAKFYVGSRIHGAIPSLIHGANIQLLYTTNKSDVLNSAMSLLSKYYPDIQNSCNIFQFNQSVQADELLSNKQVIDQNQLNHAIEREKLRVRQLIATKPHLSKYLLI